MLSVATINPSPRVNIARSAIATGRKSSASDGLAPSGHKSRNKATSERTNVTRVISTRTSGKDQLGQIDLPDQPFVVDDRKCAVIQADAEEAPGNHAGEQKERIVARRSS